MAVCVQMMFHGNPTPLSLHGSVSQFVIWVAPSPVSCLKCLLHRWAPRAPAEEGSSRAAGWMAGSWPRAASTDGELGMGMSEKESQSADISLSLF